MNGKPKIKINWQREFSLGMSSRKWACCGMGLVAYADSPEDAYKNWILERRLDQELRSARELANIDFFSRIHK